MAPRSLLHQIKTLGFRAMDAVSPGLIENSQVGKYASSNVSPLATPASSEQFAAGALLPTPGIDLDQAQQEALLREIATHRGLFAQLRSSAVINTVHHGIGDKIRNGFYPTPDAETYAAMIAIRRPARIVEIGGGFSTLIARSAIDQLGLETELVVIDPEPRTDVTRAADKVIFERVEQAGLGVSDFPDPSILFIDSSHIVRSGGDVPFLYGQLVPSLPPGVTVHVHDIYLPFDYSKLGLDLWWTEQYVLQALLSNNPHCRIDLATRWMTAMNPDLMAEVFGDIVTTDPAHGGGSLWFTTR